MAGHLDGVPGQTEDGAQRPDYNADDVQGARPVPSCLAFEYGFDDALTTSIGMYASRVAEWGHLPGRRLEAPRSS